MIFLHETHEVRGSRADDFERAYRDRWMPVLAEGSEARLLWYFDHVHGTGPSYEVVTITAISDGAAWESLARRVQSGDLSDWTSIVDDCRHDVSGKLLVPVRWSPMQQVELADVGANPAERHGLTLYMEDTGWPYSPLDDYIEFWGSFYHPMLLSAPESHRMLEIQACFQVAHGTHLRREAILLQKIHSHERLLDLLTTEVPPSRRGPGTYMHEALAYRDQWRSRLLRTSSWSPCW
jgi:hypothetical protein